jgi:hypothetical protein
VRPLSLVRTDDPPAPAASEAAPQSQFLQTAWLPGAILTTLCGSIYLALRPPLYDFDGYMYRLYALLPSRRYNTNPEHLLWNSIQIAVASFAAEIGHPTTVPFQTFGILVNCATLFLLYRLLQKASGSALVAAAGALFVGFSPSFWYLGLQNEPYPLTFLLIISFLSAWQTEGLRTPEGKRLLASGLFLTLAILLHEAVILLLPGAALALLLFGQGSLRQRFMTGLRWAMGVLLLVVVAYLSFWHTGVGRRETILAWSANYVSGVHPIQFFQLGITKTTARSVMGVSGCLLQDYRVQALLANDLRPATIYLIYDFVGLIAVVSLAAFAGRSNVRSWLFESIRSNALFAISLLSLLAWSLFAFAWEPATAHYWTLGLFPALVCIAVALRDAGGTRLAFASCILLLSVWNGYFNHAFDVSGCSHFSDAFVQSIEHHVRKRDVFVVLSCDQWLANVNYILLFRILQYTDPGRGIAIFNDLVFQSGGAKSWQKQLRERINSTLEAGGRVYVAAHVFDKASYKDLSQAGDPFNEQLNPRYLKLDSRSFYRDIQRVFSNYKLEKSGFSLGKDHYFSVERKAAPSRAASGVLSTSLIRPSATMLALRQAAEV